MGEVGGWGPFLPDPIRSRQPDALVFGERRNLAIFPIRRLGIKSKGTHEKSWETQWTRTDFPVACQVRMAKSLPSKSSMSTMDVGLFAHGICKKELITKFKYIMPFRRLALGGSVCQPRTS